MKLALAVVVLCACGGNDAKPSPPPATEAGSALRALGEAERARAESDRIAAEAARARAEAEREANAARATVDQLQKELAAFTERVNAGVDAVASAQNDADRAAAKAKLAALMKEKAELEARLAGAGPRVINPDRMKGVTLSKECLANPLANGCQ